MPQRLQSKACSIALAMGLANTSIFDNTSSDTSNILSTSIFGTTNTCPLTSGAMSRMAIKLSSSATIAAGISLEIILEKIDMINVIQ